MIAVAASQPHKLKVSGSNPLLATINYIIMEGQEKYFNVLASNNIRSLVSELNKNGYTRDDIVAYSYDAAKGQHYVITYR